MEFNKQEQKVIDTLKAETDISQRNELIDILIEHHEGEINEINEKLEQLTTLDTEEFIKKAIRTVYNDQINHLNKFNDVLRSLKQTGGKRRRKTQRRKVRKNKTSKRK